MKKRLFFNIISSFLVGVVIFLAITGGWLYSFNSLFQDKLYQKENTASSSIKIISIDEKTLSKLGQFENWTREPYARLINTINTEDVSPRVIGIDVLFANSKGKEDDLLIEACQNYPNVILASNLIFTTKLQSYNGSLQADNLHIEAAELPFKELSQYTKFGFANAVKDSKDGYIRYALLNQEEHRSFALQVALASADNQVELQDFTEKSGMFIDYTARPGTYEVFSMIDVLDGKISPAVFDDCIVLVGATAAGMGDAYYTPIDKGSSMYGVEINANIIQSISENRSITYISPIVNGIACGILGMVIAFLILNSKIFTGALLLILASAGNIFSAYLLDYRGIVINIIILPLAVFTVFIVNVGVKYIGERLHKRKVLSAFKKYVAPQVVEDIAKKGDYSIEIGGAKRNIAVLFVDIRGFTPLSEQLEPEQIVAILNEYLGMVTQAVFKYSGTLDKFIGDAAMAVFNAPFDCDDYTFKAVMTAKEIVKNSEEIFNGLSEKYGCSLGCGIGINCGDAIVGNIGCSFRMDYTAIGDTVNTAARLESNAAAGQVLISGDVYDKVKDRISATSLEDITLKGKKNKIPVYSLMD